MSSIKHLCFRAKGKVSPSWHCSSSERMLVEFGITSTVQKLFFIKKMFTQRISSIIVKSRRLWDVALMINFKYR